MPKFSCLNFDQKWQFTVQNEADSWVAPSSGKDKKLKQTIQLAPYSLTLIFKAKTALVFYFIISFLVYEMFSWPNII